MNRIIQRSGGSVRVDRMLRLLALLDSLEEKPKKLPEPEEALSEPEPEEVLPEPESKEEIIFEEHTPIDIYA